MESVLRSNPIYQHSAETQKEVALAQQASINEDLEQRRRLLDGRGEDHKMIVAKEVADMIENEAGRVHLKPTPFEIPAEPLLEKAQHAASNALNSAFNVGKSLLNSATAATKGAADSALHLGQDALNATKNATNSAYNAAASATNTAVHLGQDATNSALNATKNATNTALNAASNATNTAVHLGQDAAGVVSSAAHEASLQASNIAKKAVDTASSAVGAVQQKTRELADTATEKALEVADNISHFTTLVSVLAEEEKERARRLVSGEEARAATNAFRVSALIRDLGEYFYKQIPNLSYQTKLLEESERRWRLNSTHTALSESNAHNIGKLVTNNLQSFMPRYEWVRAHISGIEEKERARRLADTNEAFAITNALNLSSIIRDLGLGFYRQEGTFGKKHAGYATTLLEELERKDRIRLDMLHRAEDNAHLLMDVVANNMEKFNYTTRNAAQFANEFANMVGAATKKAAVNLSAITQDLAKNAATRVTKAASDISTYSTRMYVVALEERERARRVTDSSEINAINNAWKQSGLIRELGSLYRASSPARFPAFLIEEQERAARLAAEKPASARRVADIVSANISKFEDASARLGEVEHAKDTAAHSSLNPNAPTFVPHFGLVKQEPAIVQVAPRAAGAQL